MTDVINIDTQEIRKSVNTPDYIFEGSPWRKISNVTLVKMINKVTKVIKDEMYEPTASENWLVFSNVTGLENILESNPDNWIVELIEDVWTARDKTRDELFDFEEEKDKKIEEAKTYGRNLIIQKILELSKEMGKNRHVENALWILILQDGRQTILKTYSNAVRTAVLTKINEINACNTWEELDAITIP